MVPRSRSPRNTRTLARDAQSAGDRVIAENYLQHAEHYNRIIAAAQAQMPIQNMQKQRDDFDDEAAKTATTSTIRAMAARLMCGRSRRRCRRSSEWRQGRPAATQSAAAEPAMRAMAGGEFASSRNQVGGNLDLSWRFRRRNRDDRRHAGGSGAQPGSNSEGSPQSRTQHQRQRGASVEGRRNRRPRRGERSRPEVDAR